MPELPEVQAVINALKPDLIGKRITGFNLFWHKTLKSPPLKEFHSKILNRVINDCQRFGKWIILNLDDGDIMVHLRMSGKLFYSNLPLSKNKHIRANFYLSQGCLNFEDVRKFGRILFVDSFKPQLFNLGLDFLNNELDEKYLQHNFKSSKRNIKALLLDQSVATGLGNIYVDEILWVCGIHPESMGKDVEKIQLAEIIIIGREMLTRAIKNNGTSIRSFEVKSGEPGGFKKHLKVYGRERKNCFRCDEHIIKIRAAGRGTYLCPACQVK